MNIERYLGTVLIADNRKFCVKKGTMSCISCSSCLYLIRFLAQIAKFLIAREE